MNVGKEFGIGFGVFEVNAEKSLESDFPNICLQFWEIRSLGPYYFPGFLEQNRGRNTKQLWYEGKEFGFLEDFVETMLDLSIFPRVHLLKALKEHPQ